MVSPLKRVISYGLRVISLVIFLFLTYNASRITHHYCFAQSSQYVRVAIAEDALSLNLRINGSYKIIDSLSQKVLSGDKNLKTTVTAYKDGILIAGKSFNTAKLFIKANEPEAVIINGRRFRGDIQLIKKENVHLLVVNHLGLEDYIKGILYHESSHYWPAEALKAQAIVCRTYVVYQMQENKFKDYDVTSDIYSQVYGGQTSERSRTNEIVEATKNQILIYQGKVFPTYYHATCGGYTEDASLLWNIDLLPLKGVVCNFCQDSPHFSWHYVLSCDELKDKLADAGYKLKNIKAIQILGRDKSNRVTNLSIATDNKDINISAKDFRNIIGPNIIRSTNFAVDVAGHDVVFEGFGWGHGVGLCQWGAYFMAKQRYKYDQILKYYYPQVEIKKISKDRIL